MAKKMKMFRVNVEYCDWDCDKKGEKQWTNRKLVSHSIWQPYEFELMEVKKIDYAWFHKYVDDYIIPKIMEVIHEENKKQENKTKTRQMNTAK